MASSSVSTAVRKERKYLTLEDRIEIINLNKKGMSAKDLINKFGVGKTQIYVSF